MHGFVSKSIIIYEKLTYMVNSGFKKLLIDIIEVINAQASYIVQHQSVEAIALHESTYIAIL